MKEQKIEGFRGELKEMHEAVCSEYGKMTKFSFKPDGIRPVYCKECYIKRKSKKY